MLALVCEPNRGHQVVKKAIEDGAQSAFFFQMISSVYWRLQSTRLVLRHQKWFRRSQGFPVWSG